MFWDSLLTGLGFGLGFWIVLIPIALIIKTPKSEREAEQKKIDDHWTSQLSTFEKQVSVLMGISALLEMKNMKSAMEMIDSVEDVIEDNDQVDTQPNG